MSTNDYLVRILTKEGNVRALACVTTTLAREAAARHGALPTAAAGLGRALTGAALMGALLKTGQRLALKFEGNGPLKKIIVEGDSNGAVRGLVGNPAVDRVDVFGKLDVAGALGKAGFLTVSKDLGMKEPYKSTVQLYSSEIGADLAYYLTESEQIPSAVGVGVYTDTDGAIAAAGGFLVQALPPQDDGVIDLLMERIGQLPGYSELLKQGETPEEVLERLFSGIPYTVLEKRALALVCSCSRDRLERVLMSLGEDELREMIDHGEAEVTCEFCSERYHFDREQLKRLMAEIAAPPAED